MGGVSTGIIHCPSIITGQSEKREIAIEKWRAKRGKWKMENEKWEVKSGKCKTKM